MMALYRYNKAAETYFKNTSNQGYEELELEVVEFDSEDVITTSPYEFEPGPDETEPGA